jgi:hypothetical protein
VSRNTIHVVGQLAWHCDAAASDRIHSEIHRTLRVALADLLNLVNGWPIAHYVFSRLPQAKRADRRHPGADCFSAGPYNR